MLKLGSQFVYIIAPRNDKSRSISLLKCDRIGIIHGMGDTVFYLHCIGLEHL